MGLSIGLIALAFPQTLFFSEEQIETVIQTGATLSVVMLIAIAVTKTPITPLYSNGTILVGKVKN